MTELKEEDFSKCRGIKISIQENSPAKKTFKLNTDKPYLIGVCVCTNFYEQKQPMPQHSVHMCRLRSQSAV